MGATSTESFEALKKDIPVDLAIYAKENNLSEFDGWDTLKWVADRSKLTERLVKQAKLHSLKYAPQYKYGFKIPKIMRMLNNSIERIVTMIGWMQINWNTNSLGNIMYS